MYSVDDIPVNMLLLLYHLVTLMISLQEEKQRTEQPKFEFKIGSYTFFLMITKSKVK